MDYHNSYSYTREDATEFTQAEEYEKAVVFKRECVYTTAKRAG